MRARPITEEDYALILESDKKVYPTDSPVTADAIRAWYKRNPEFGIVYEDSNRIVGMCVAIPLNASGWKRLVRGELAESELDGATIFNNSRDKEIGIHIYHLERSKDSMKGFYRTALQGLSDAIKGLKEHNKDLAVIGFSGLCVTADGIGLFETLGCRERDYICQEHILEKDGKRVVLKTGSKDAIDSMIKDGYRHLNRCKMLVTYPSENSVVWEYLK